jgi:plastocyanin
VKRLAVLALAGALLAAGCSNRSAAKPPVAITGRVVEKGRADDTAEGAEVHVAMDSGDNYFSPTYVKASPGARVTLDITNVGTIAHTFTIDSAHIDKVFGRKGDKATVTVVMPPAGQALVFYCKYHREAGMQGALYSTPAP